MLGIPGSACRVWIVITPRPVRQPYKRHIKMYRPRRLPYDTIGDASFQAGIYPAPRHSVGSSSAESNNESKSDLSLCPRLP